MSAHALSPQVSGLASLVELEARLDRMIADAREAARTTREAARRRAEIEAATLEAAIAREVERVTAEIAAAAEAQILTIEGAIRAEIARFDAVQGPILDDLAARLATRLAALALEEAGS